MMETQVRIRTKTPVILPCKGDASDLTETQEFFSGSVLRGILARQFIGKKKLDDDAHEDEVFRKLFFGDLRFVHAYPYDPQNDARTMILPLSLQRSKDGTRIKDLLQSAPEPNFKGMKGFAMIAEGEIHSVDVRKSIGFHMSRTDLKSEGGTARLAGKRKNCGGDGTERLAGKSQSGGIYNYEAIAAGQEFLGYVYGSAQSLHTLLEYVEERTFSCYVGRSKYTQYGLCEVTLIEPQPVQRVAAPAGNRVYLRMETPFIPQGGTSGDVASMLTEITDRLNESGCGRFSLAKKKSVSNAVTDALPYCIFAKTEEIDNFVVVWGLRRPRETALAAGTVFAVEKDGIWQDTDTAVLDELCRNGVGRRRAEGFGQLRVWTCDDLRWGTPRQMTCDGRESISEKTKALARKILLAHIIEQVKHIADEDAKGAMRAYGSCRTHPFTRLEQDLGVRVKNAKLSMEGSVADYKKGTPIADMVENIKIGEHSLRTYFTVGTEIATMPYYAKAAETMTPDSDLAKAADKIGMEINELLCAEDVYHAYWHAFFRYARKRVKATDEER